MFVSLRIYETKTANLNVLIPLMQLFDIQITLVHPLESSVFISAVGGCGCIPDCLHPDHSELPGTAG